MASETETTAPRTALLVDWGGVLTTNLFTSFGRFCEDEGLAPEELITRFRSDRETRELLIAFEEGRVEEPDFAERLGARLGVAHERLIDRLFAHVGPDAEMIAAVAAARAAGIRTGLVSNSWGTRRYDRAMLAELFDGVVISGEVGIRKPAPAIYALGAERTGVAPEACVFVDDLPFNLTPAAELGMATVHHTSTAETVRELETLLGVPLAPAAELASIRPRMRRAAIAVLCLLAVLALGACGSDGSLSAGALRTQASRICVHSATATDRIVVPDSADQGGRFLTTGAAKMRPALAELRALKAPSDLRTSYTDALHARTQELTLITQHATAIAHGEDAIAGFRTLQTQLEPIVRIEIAAWRALEIPSCVPR